MEKFYHFLGKKKKEEKYWNKESVDDLSNFCSLFALCACSTDFLNAFKIFQEIDRHHGQAKFDEFDKSV